MLKDFLMDLQSMFDHMVDMTEPICQKLDPHLAAMTIFDTSGIEALLPVLVDFFQKHPLIAPKTFLGDAAFDTIEICKSLFGEIGFEKAFISLRVKLSMDDTGYTINENGVPCCPHDPSLPMKREASKSHLKSKILMLAVQRFLLTGITNSFLWSDFSYVLSNFNASSLVLCLSIDTFILPHFLSYNCISS